MKTKAFFIVPLLLLASSRGYAQTWTAQKSSHFGMDGFETADLFKLQPLQLDTAYRWEAAGLRNGNVAWNRTLSPVGGQFRWDVIEHTAGIFDWSKPDSFVKRIQAEGLQLLVLVHPYAQWDQPSKTSMNYDKPNNMTAFKRFVARLVERYDGDGIDDMPGLLYPIEYYEIGNEPEGSTFGDSPGTYNDFMETVKAAYDTAKIVFPGVKIVIGGASPIYDSHGLNNGVDAFWKGALNRANVGSYFDVFNFHFFVGQYTHDISDYCVYWKQLLSTYGLSGKEIWLTETGTYSGTSTGPDGVSWPTQSTAYQASWWVKQAAYSLANGISKLFWVFYYSDQSDWRSTVAFVSLDKTTKKAVYYSHKLMAEKIDAYSSVAQNAYAAPSQNQTSGNVKFIVGGKPVFVVWSDQGGSAKLAGFSSAKVKITNAVASLDGNGNVVLDGSGNPTFLASESNVSNGQVVVTLSSVPVLVEESVGVPALPTLVSPVDGATGISVTPTLIWNSSSGAATYRLQVSMSSLFSTTVFDDSTIADTSKQVGPLVNNSTYYWRVSSTNSGGTSSFSTARSFTTASLSTRAVYDKIAFTRQASTNVWNIWLMDLNGQNQTKLLDSQYKDFDPHFRSDGTKIVFDRTIFATPPAIYTMNSDGTGVMNLTSDLTSDATRPKWSWDGTKIVFNLSVSAENLDIYVMNADGTSRTPLITGSTNDLWPSFSPDGKYVVFDRLIGPVSNQKSAICRYSIDSATTTYLTDGSDLDEMPVYSPDGRYILFKRGVTNPEIYRLHVDNLTSDNLTNNSAADDAPMYSYDGTKIAWMSASGGGQDQIWIMNSDGTGKTQLTSSSVANFNPTFSPSSVVLQPPALTSPANGATGVSTSPALSWSGFAGATSYRVQVSTSSDFSTTVLDSSAVTATSLSVPHLTSGSLYYWRVNATSGTATSAWSSTWSFTTIIAAPQPPSLASPADSAQNVPLSTTLSWNTVSGATSYRLQVSTSPTFSVLILDDSTLAGTSRQVGPLQNGTSYSWRVCAKNNGGTSSWSLVRSFTTIVVAPTAPTLLSPADGSRNLPVMLTLTWNASTGATSYRVQVASNPSFSIIVLDDSTVTATSRSVGPLANNTLYYWRVRAKNNGGTSAFSDTWGFSTIVALPAIPTTLSPDDSAKNVSLNPTIRWNPADGATSYHLQVSMTSAFTTNVVDDTTLTGTQSTIGPLDLSTTYYWRVRARNIAGYSAFSATRSFKTILTTSVEQIGGDLPKEYALNQNYPNPFNPSTTIQFALPKGAYVTLRVFDALGKEVAALVTRELGPGYFAIRWPANVPSGIYFYRLQAGEFVETKKMILIR